MCNKKFYLLLGFTIFLYIFTFKSELILSSLANYGYLTGNKTLAYKNTEKLFSINKSNKNLEEKYLSSVLEKFPNIESQEKLVKFIDYNVSEDLKAVAENKIDELQEEIEETYPENFIMQTTINQKVMRWNMLPITYAFVKSGEALLNFESEIDNAFNEWEVMTDRAIQFEKINDADNANIKIAFIENNPANKNSVKFVMAYTTPLVINNVLKSSEIKFYTKNPLGKEFTPNQIYNTALHEIAHALGFMGHSENKKDILFMSSNTRIHYENKRDLLSLGDINTIKLLYKIKPEVTNHVNNNATYIPYIALGSKKEISSAKFQEALNYVKNSPNLPNGYMHMAEIYSQEKLYTKALKCLKLALERAVSPDSKSVIYYNLGVVSYNIGEYENAKNYMYKSISFGDNQDKQFFLAQTNIKLKNSAEAIEILEALTRKYPKNIEYALSLTSLYSNEKQFFKVKKVIDYYNKNNPEDANNPRFNAFGILKTF